MKSFFKISAVVLCLAVAAGCSGPQRQNSSGSSAARSGVSSKATDFPYEFRDSLDQRVVLKSRPKRVVCLMGSYAELWTLAGGALAGTTEDAVSERKLELGKDVEIIGSVKKPNLEKILAISPDFVILSSELEAHLKISDQLKMAGIPFAYFKVNYFDDYLHVLGIFTGITGRADLFDKNGAEVRKQVDAVIHAADRTKKPAVLFLRTSSSGVGVQKDDSMTGRMLKDLNCENIANRQASPLRNLSMENILEADPDFIFVTVMGSDTEKALGVLKKDFQSNPAWSTLSAVRQNHYYVLPKELFQYKPNAKWGMSYEYLAKLLYPAG